MNPDIQSAVEQMEHWSVDGSDLMTGKAELFPNSTTETRSTGMKFMKHWLHHKHLMTERGK